MRFRENLPPLDQIKTIVYPRSEYPAPVLIFLCLLMRRKAIGRLNLNCPFDDADGCAC